MIYIPRYEFGSSEWLAAFQGTFAACVVAAARDEPALSFSMSEVCNNAPASIKARGGIVGWNAVVRDGELVRFTGGLLDDIGYRLTADYEILQELTRFHIGDDIARAQSFTELGSRYWEQGLIKVEGRRPKLPPSFSPLHDLVAAFTV
jgi:hypothetical protein